MLDTGTKGCCNDYLEILVRLKPDTTEEFPSHHEPPGSSARITLSGTSAKLTRSTCWSTSLSSTSKSAAFRPRTGCPLSVTSAHRDSGLFAMVLAFAADRRVRGRDRSRRRRATAAVLHEGRGCSRRRAGHDSRHCLVDRLLLNGRGSAPLESPPTATLPRGGSSKSTSA